MKNTTVEKIKNDLEELKSLIKIGECKLLNFNQAADYLGFSHSYLYKLTSRKIIPCHKPMGRLYFYKHELDAWITRKENFSTDADNAEQQTGASDDDNEEDIPP